MTIERTQQRILAKEFIRHLYFIALANFLHRHRKICLSTDKMCVGG